MLDLRDYYIRMWSDGDVSIEQHDTLSFTTMGYASGFQCNDDSRREDIRKACLDVANAMRALDVLLDAE